MLEIKGLKVKVEGKEVLKGINLNIDAGKVVAIMGPNGSGKSSLVNTIVGSSVYEVTGGEIFFEGEQILNMKADERAKRGIMMVFQYPLAIPGVKVREMLLTALRTRGEKVSALELKKRIEEEADKLKLERSLLERNINEGFSGGEKKKMEVLQMRILKPKLLILDEVDSGLDIDALQIIAESVREMVVNQNMAVLVITHYQRLLHFLKPDEVVVLKDGKIVDKGGNEIVDKLEKNGYQIYEN